MHAITERRTFGDCPMNFKVF